MNKNFFILFMIIAFLSVVGLSYETLQDYVEWHITLNKINPNAIYFSDTHVGLIDKYSSTTLTHIDYVSDDSIKATFNQNNFFIGDYKITDEFEFVKTIHEGDKFIEVCHPYRDTCSSFWHFAVGTSSGTTCT